MSGLATCPDSLSLRLSVSRQQTENVFSFGLWLARSLLGMSRRAKITRRKFMQLAATAAAVGPVAACGGLKSPWRFFSAAEAQTLGALCERIIPADQDPGAAWAGVVNYLDIQLSGPYRKLRPTYRQGLAGVDQSSQILFGRKFAELPSGQQDEVLRALEKGAPPGDTWKRLASARFFDLLVTHTMQGFYGDPRHGGNRERVSWRMVGLAYPPIRGRLHYDLSQPAKSPGGSS